MLNSKEIRKIKGQWKKECDGRKVGGGEKVGGIKSKREHWVQPVDSLVLYKSPQPHPLC